jgi:cobalt-zinc-cadmium efflux system outer membrane protein
VVLLVQLAALRPLAAQEAERSARPPVVLGAVIERVERNNPRIAAARALARAASARVPSATRPPDPQLQLGFMNYELPALRQMDIVGMTQLQLMQMVPVAGKLRLAGDVERYRADAATARIAVTTLDLRSRVAMVYYDVYAVDGSLRVASGTRRLLQDIATIAGRMYQQGEGRQADVLRATVESARMEEEIIRLQTMRRALEARVQALAADSGNAVGAPQLPRFPLVLPPLDSLLDLAGAARPMLRAGALEVQAAASGAQLARREIWPDLQVGLQLASQRNGGGSQAMGSVMLGAALPIFASSRQMERREEANAMQAMAAADLTTMRADTRGAVAEAYVALERARRLAELYRVSVLPQAEAAVASSRAAYRVSAIPFVALLDAQMAVNRYRQELFALEAEEGKAWAELEMLTGRPLIDAFSARPASPEGGPSK